jgi:glycosyltransferase involved in cell wall biosynthesis
MSQVSVSVVVCTRNRAASLKRCIAAFEKVSASNNFELVVVDNGSSDGTGTFLSSLPKALGKATVTVVHEARRGQAVAQHTGYRNTTGSLIAFTDDDCYVATDYIQQIEAAFCEPAIGYIGGRILLYDQTDLRLTINEREVYEPISTYSFIHAGTVQGANMCFRKTTLETIGGFDLRFAKYSSCDVATVAHASWAGISGAYDPRPTVFHHHQRKTKKQSRKLRQFYAIGRGAYYAKFMIRPDSRHVYLRCWFRITINRLKNSTSIKALFLSFVSLFLECYGFVSFVFFDSQTYPMMHTGPAPFFVGNLNTVQ